MTVRSSGAGGLKSKGNVEGDAASPVLWTLNIPTKTRHPIPLMGRMPFSLSIDDAH